MPNVAFEKQSEVAASLTVSIAKAELETELKKELKTAQKTANMRGFRKGKAPMSTLRKMMGNEMLGRILDKKINEALFGYIDEEKLDVIFSPMPAVEQEQIDVNANNLQDVSLRYDLALRPNFELALPKQTFERFQLKTDDAFIEERLTAIRRQGTEPIEVESDVQDNDILTVEFAELDGKKLKADGVRNEAKVFIDAMEPKLAKKLMGKNVGATATVDINAVEKEADEKYVRKYLLEVEDEEVTYGEKFRLTIKGITRREMATLDEAFFQKFDPSGAITDEAGLRERIAEDNAGGFNKQGDSILNFEIQEALVEGIELELPEDFMRRANEDSKDPYERFERSIRWMLIRTEYAKEKGIELKEEDLRSSAKEQLIAMMGGQRPEWLNDEFIDNYAARMMEDEKQRDELVYRTMETKIMDSLREEVKTKVVALTAEEFNEKITAFNTRFQEEEE